MDEEKKEVKAEKVDDTEVAGPSRPIKEKEDFHSDDAVKDDQKKKVSQPVANTVKKRNIEFTKEDLEKLEKETKVVS